LKFKVHDEVFNKLPDLYFGVVIGYDINNTKQIPEIYNMVCTEMEKLKIELDGKNLKEHECIIPYRDTFKELGINPNKYMSSIEAMAKRASKGNMLPSINPIVNLVNALSLKYILPMGAHDIDSLEGEIAVRFSKEGDIFTPLGEENTEILQTGELVYADINRIRTRRWIWRQSDIGRIDKKSTNILFPIDGFISSNKENVIKATEELENLLKKYFNCETNRYYLDKDNKEVEL